MLAAIQHYVQDMDAATGTAVMAVYTNEIDGCYIAYTGNGTSGNATSFLNANSNYVRIDGPNVWIEMSCQSGVVIQGQIHYHTLWRDHAHDYGVDLAGPAIDGGSGGGVAVANVIPVKVAAYPNPATGTVGISIPGLLNPRVQVIDVATGRTVQIILTKSATSVELDIAHLAAGIYTVRIDNGGKQYLSKFTKL